MKDLVFAVGVLMFFLTMGGLVLFGGYLLEALTEDNPPIPRRTAVVPADPPADIERTAP